MSSSKSKVKEVEVTDGISAKVLADELGIEAKAFRRWLRRHTENRAGKGGRWVFSADEVTTLKAAYAKDPDPVAADA